MRICAIFLLLALAAGGCATTLHPERVNQPVSQRDDVDNISAIGDLAVPGGSLLLIYDISNGAINKPKVDPSAPPKPAPKPTSDFNTAPPTPAP